MNSPVTITSNHIASTEAALRYGLTSDHIASLCRRKKVDGSLMGGRVWFVNEESLKAYLTKTKEEKEVRNRELSRKIRSEQNDTPSHVPSWRLAGSGSALALAVFIVGSVYVSAAPAHEALAEVPWSQLPASVASVSADFYDATFMSAAVGYFSVLDEVGDLQAQSYRTLGAATVSVINRVPISPSAPKLQSNPRAAFSAVAPVSFDADSATRGLVAALGAQHIQLPPVELYHLSGASGTDVSVLEVLVRFPAELADTMTVGFADMTTWYAQGLLVAAQRLGDTQANLYTQAAAAELSLSDLLADTWTTVAWSIADHFVAGVYAVAEGQVYVYQAVADTMNESSETMGAAVAGVLHEVVSSADGIAYWYRDASKRVSARTESSSNTASVYDGWTDWLAGTFFTPKVIQPEVPGASAPVSLGATEQKVARVLAAATPVRSSAVSEVVPVSPLYDAAPQTVQYVSSAQYVTQDSLAAQLNQLANTMRSLVYENAAGGVVVPQYIAASNNSGNPGLSARIDKLNGIVLTGSTITGSTIAGYLPDSSPVGTGTGGTGTSTAPSYGQVLLGNRNGSYDLVATSSLGISGGGGTVNLYATTTIGDGTQIGGLTVSGGATTTGNAYFGGRIGIGTTSPASSLSVQNSYGAAAAALFSVASSTSSDGSAASNVFTVTSSGNATLTGTLTVGSCSGCGGSGTFSFTPTTSFGSTANATSTLMLFSGGLSASSTVRFGNAGAGLFTFDSSTGRLGLGTSTPYAALSVAGSSGIVANIFTATSTVATSTLSGGLNVGSGAITYDYSSGVTSIQSLAVGSMSFDTDAGILTWADLPVSSSASAGTVESYTANMDGNGVLTVYGESDGSGGVQNLRVGIGTTSPYAMLSVAGQVVGSYFAATSSTASRFPFASTTMITAATASTTALVISGTPGCSATQALTTNSSGTVSCGTISSGSFPFTATSFGVSAANSTSTLMGFSAGLYALASSTVGNGSQGGGLTIFGGATTTAAAYFAGNVGIATSSQLYNFFVAATTTAFAGNAAVGTWQTGANSLPQSISGHAVLTSGGYVYVFGGYTGSVFASGVYYAKLNSDGSVGAWQTGTSLPVATENMSAGVYNGYVYLFGGDVSAGNTTTVYYAKLNTDGSVGTWQLSPNNLPNDVNATAVALANGYAYLIGGSDGLYRSAVYYAKISADGSVGPWLTESNSLSTATANMSYVTANGYVYIFGGLTGSGYTTAVSYAKLNPDGTTGVWQSGSALPGTRAFSSAVTVNGYVYVYGGFNGTAQSSVYYAKLNADGTLGSWQTTTSLPASRYHAMGVVSNGYIYQIGGQYDNSVNNTSSTVYYASLSRTIFGGVVDLLGFSSSTLADGGGGSSLYAGDIFSKSRLTVLGEALLSGGLRVDGAFMLNATTSQLQSGPIFTINNATGTAPIFSASYEGNVSIGTSSSLARLYVQSPNAGGSVPAFSVASTSGTSLTVRANGRVSVGASSPNTAAQMAIQSNSSSVLNVASFADNTTDQGSMTTEISFSSKLISSDSITYPMAYMRTYKETAEGFVGSGISFWNMDQGANMRERFRISKDANIGFSTSSPYARLSISMDGIDNNGLYYGPSFVIASSTMGTATTTHVMVTNTGKFGIGSTTPLVKFQVAEKNTGGEVAYLVNTGTGSGDEVLHLGVGNATAGTSNLFVSFYQGSSGTSEGTRIGYIQGSGSNSVTYNTTSDQRLKENIVDTTKGLSDLMQIQIKDFNFKISPGHTVQGFIAQQLETVYPDAVAVTDDGVSPLASTSIPWGVDYGRITPLIIRSVQEIASIGGTFKTALVAWLADAQNGITTLFAGEIRTKKLCVDDVCVTREQFLRIVQAAGAEASSSASDPILDTDTPVITLNGNNPAVLSVGDTYSDLGAIVTDNTDQNLSVYVQIDGGATTTPESITVDTSTTGSHTVLYFATDRAGNRGEVMRTVTVQEAASSQ